MPGRAVIRVLIVAAVFTLAGCNAAATADPAATTPTGTTTTEVTP